MPDVLWLGRTLWGLFARIITQQGVPVEQSRGKKGKEKPTKSKFLPDPVKTVTPVVKVLYFNLSIPCCIPFDQKEVIVSIRRKQINVL